MRLVEEGKNLLLTQIKDFDIKQTLECGQCFNFIELADKDYAILAQGRDLRIKQEGHDLVFFDTDKKTMEEVWIPYFDLDRDYEAIKKDLLNMDPKLEVSIKALYGMRILRQDFLRLSYPLFYRRISKFHRLRPVSETLAAFVARKWSTAISFLLMMR